MIKDDSDETEGRKLYRDRADALAASQTNYARRKVRVIETTFNEVTCRKKRCTWPECKCPRKDRGRLVPHHGSGPDNL